MNTLFAFVLPLVWVIGITICLSFAKISLKLPINNLRLLYPVVMLSILGSVVGATAACFIFLTGLVLSDGQIDSDPRPVLLIFIFIFGLIGSLFAGDKGIKYFESKG